LSKQNDGRRTARRLTAGQFQACIPLVEHILKAERIEAARAVLVDGDGQTEVGARYNWSRQAVNICVDKLWDAHERFEEAKRYETEAAAATLPRGWVQAIVVAPRRMLEKFLEQVEEFKA
jgi:hypothetical protein